jgi:enamine deaminase RidA (YjgF/YER057c/UK114 family)
MIRRWNPPSVAAPAGQYSHLAAVPAGHELVFVSGQLGLRPDGILAGPDAETPTRQVLANIREVLAAAGGGPEHIVKFLSLIAGVEHLAGSRAARAEIFAEWYPDGDFPAHSLMVVTQLAAPEFAVEIEAVAAIPAVS